MERIRLKHLSVLRYLKRFEETEGNEIMSIYRQSLLEVGHIYFIDK